MELIELEKTILTKDNQTYQFIKFDEPLDMSEENDNVQTFITYVLKGFVEDLVVIQEIYEETIDNADGAIYFGYLVGDTGLIVHLEDEKIANEAMDLLIEALGEDWN